MKQLAKAPLVLSTSVQYTMKITNRVAYLGGRELAAKLHKRNTTVGKANNSESSYLTLVKQTAPKDTTILTEVENRKARRNGN